MTYYSFSNDYSEGAHPQVLAALSDDNLIQEPGYGADSISLEATEILRSRCAAPTASVYFVAGGTQANLLICAASLKPYEAVIAAEVGHICVHETGAIETTGHKIVVAAHKNGKLTPESILGVTSLHTSEHMVRPKLVFISQATEVGTVYTKSELTNLSEACRSMGLLLYLDGARLGAALSSNASDLTFADIAELVDVFYVGGTKNGALFGEAIVICNPIIAEDFRYVMKQRGALLAKGRVLGAQFRELFRGDLFMSLARIAVDRAARLADGIRECGFELAYPAETNQLFPQFPNQVIERLKQRFGFYTWSKLSEDESIVRLVTSWATPEAAVNDFVEELRKC